MREARLAPDEVVYLRGADYLPEPLYQIVVDKLGASVGVRTTVSVDDAVAEALRDAFTLRLAQVGFDGAYELTPEGFILEDLIDRFGP